VFQVPLRSQGQALAPGKVLGQSRVPDLVLVIPRQMRAFTMTSSRITSRQFVTVARALSSPGHRCQASPRHHSSNSGFPSGSFVEPSPVQEYREMSMHVWSPGLKATRNPVTLLCFNPVSPSLRKRYPYKLGKPCHSNLPRNTGIFRPRILFDVFRWVTPHATSSVVAPCHAL
jgi:hypothetical protein